MDSAKGTESMNTQRKVQNRPLHPFGYVPAYFQAGNGQLWRSVTTDQTFFPWSQPFGGTFPSMMPIFPWIFFPTSAIQTPVYRGALFAPCLPIIPYSPSNELIFPNGREQGVVLQPNTPNPESTQSQHQMGTSFESLDLQRGRETYFQPMPPVELTSRSAHQFPLPNLASHSQHSGISQKDRTPISLNFSSAPKRSQNVLSNSLETYTSIVREAGDFVPPANKPGLPAPVSNDRSQNFMHLDLPQVPIAPKFQFQKARRKSKKCKLVNPLDSCAFECSEPQNIKLTILDKKVEISVAKPRGSQQNSSESALLYLADLKRKKINKISNLLRKHWKDKNFLTMHVFLKKRFSKIGSSKLPEIVKYMDYSGLRLDSLVQK